MLGDSKLAGLVPAAIALAMLAFHFWVVAVGAPETFHFRSTHLLFALVLIFLWYPVLTGRSRGLAAAGALIDSAFLAASAAHIASPARAAI